MLILLNNIRKKMCSHAKREYPGECCGIILGRRSGEQRIAHRIIPTENTTEDNRNATHFSIDPLEVAKAEVSADREQLEIVGFYHSHPEYEAVASAEDIRHMIAGYSYPIISVKNGRCVEVNCFEKIKQTDTDAKKEVWEEK